MNGQRLVQAAQANGWATQKVDKAGALKPGIYDLYLATPVDKSRTYDGTMLYADSASVYQKVGKDYIKHQREDFAKIPEPGSAVNIRYDGGRAVVASTAATLARGRSR